MKKKFLFSLILALACAIFIISCGSPKYLGHWFMGKNALSKTIENAANYVFNECGITDKDSDKANMMAGQIEYLFMNNGMLNLCSLDLKEDGNFTMISQVSGEHWEGQYSVSKDNDLTLTVDNESVEFGSFNEDFTELTVYAFEDSVEFNFVLEKEGKNSQECVFLWPEIEKGAGADIEAVKELIKNGADPNYGVNSDGERLFFAAIEENCPEDIILYLITNTDARYINSCDEYEDTALLNILSKDDEASLNIVKALIDAGADITLGKSWGYNPLQYAIKYCSEDVAIYMIGCATKDQLNMLVDDSSTCLCVALSKDDEASLNIVKALIDAGADITLGSVWGLSPILYAKKYCSVEISNILTGVQLQ